MRRRGCRIAVTALVMLAGACGSGEPAGGDLAPCHVVDSVLDQMFVALAVDLYDATRDRPVWDGARPPGEYLDVDGAFRDDIPVDDAAAFAEWKARPEADAFAGWIKSTEVNAVLDPHRQRLERAVVSVLTPCRPDES